MWGKLDYKYANDKKYSKARNNWNYEGEYRAAGYGKCNLKYSAPKKITVIFQYGSNYSYYFIMKELSEEFEKQFTRLGENIKKCINLSFLIEKEIKRIDKKEMKLQKSYLTN